MVQAVVISKVNGIFILMVTECNNAPNKSMDTSAKQRLSYQRLLSNAELRVIGFAPRYLNRSMFPFEK